MTIAPAPRGKFLSFEGGDGSGKSTQLALLARRLESSGFDVVATREPGGTELGRALRAVLLRPSESAIAVWTELLLYVADRAQHVSEVILPALARGAIVLSDRYLDATVAYQGYGRGLEVSTILDLHGQPPLHLRPDRTVLLDLEVEAGLQRARRRDATRGAADEGRFEAERIEFHERVRAGYLRLARDWPARIRTIDAGGESGAVEARIWEAVADLFQERG
jgi:dTMP kinase